MKTSRIYISGPISGRKREDYLLDFAAAQVELEACGYEVVNPCRLAPCRWPWLYSILGYRLTLLYDLWHLMHCNGIYLLYGWQHSRGARIEYEVARQLGIHEVQSYA